VWSSLPFLAQDDCTDIEKNNDIANISEEKMRNARLKNLGRTRDNVVTSRITRCSIVEILLVASALKGRRVGEEDSLRITLVFDNTLSILEGQ
jgi:hypothetical protein